jgi:Methylamine utilisation protein MauE
VTIASTLGASVAGPFVAASALLVVSGAGKLARPAVPRIAARAAGLPLAGAVVAAFGATEVAAGIAGGILGGRWAVVVAACYVALTAFAFTLLRRAPSTPCACLGSSSAAVTPSHIVLDALAAGVAIIAASNGSPWMQFSAHWIAAVVFIVLVACCVRLASLALEALPGLEAAAKEGSS